MPTRLFVGLDRPEKREDLAMTGLGLVSQRKGRDAVLEGVREREKTAPVGGDARDGLIVHMHLAMPLGLFGD